MVNKIDKKRAHDLFVEAKKKGLIKSYSEFCKSNVAKQYKLKEEDVAYYISNNKIKILSKKIYK